MDESGEQAVASTNGVNKENEYSFFRAAEISSLCTSITLGPRSVSLNSLKESTSDEKELPKSKENPALKTSSGNNNNNRRSAGSAPDINDLRNLNGMICQRSEERRIQAEALKKLEEKRLGGKEEKVYREIQEKFEKMRIEAELNYKRRMEELEKQMQNELKIENERENQHLAQRRELTANSSKILVEQEKKLLEMKREQAIKTTEELFSKQEDQFLKVLQACAFIMATMTEAFKNQYNSRKSHENSIEAFKKQCIEVKDFKKSQKNSVEGIKAATTKLEAITQNLIHLKNDIENQVRALIVAQRDAEENQRKEEAAQKEAAAKQLEQAQQQQQQATSNDNSLNAFYFRQYNDMKRLLATKKSQTKLLDETPELQQIRFALKVAINNSVNLFNEKNKSTLIQGFQKLVDLLSGQRISTAKGNVAITDHNEAADWCRLRIAEKIIDRCDKEPELIFYSAAVATALWQRFPDFGDIFKALIYKECPFLMPFKPPMLKNQSNDDFLQSWGFRLKEDGKCEAHTYYVGRTTKFAGLLAALWINQPRRGDPPIPPFGIENGWKYLASVLNQQPDSNYLHIIGKILETAGFMLLQVYGEQFRKIMLIIRDSYLPTVQQSLDEETSAPFNRLRDTVAKFYNENRFEEPKGRLMAGYW